jgi:hypothetical protein
MYSVLRLLFGVFSKSEKWLCIDGLFIIAALLCDVVVLLGGYVLLG